MRQVLVTGPTEEPVTLAEAAAFLKVDQEITGDAELTADVTRLITAARSWAETFTRRAIVGQDWRLTLPSFPGALANQVIELPLGRCLAVTNISYRSTDGTWITMLGPSSTPAGDEFDEDLDGVEGGEVYPFAGESWPATLDDRNCVKILGRFGFGDPENVPGDVKQAILMRMTDMFEGRGPDDKKWTGAAEAVLAPYVIYGVGR